MRHIVRNLGACTLAALTALIVPGAASAQAFGRNKVQYEKFDFRVLATEHFDIYYYPAENRAAAEMGRLAERWYARLSVLLSHQLVDRQAIVLYASHPDFEQTNVIEGELDEGTGGVTESARRRIVLPMAASIADSDHVLGHELVHAFQYDMLGSAAEGVPLWFIEGMAEYLSIGPRDASTAMWIRDAAIENKLPKVTDLDDPKYFPYRFGHAFWAYVTGLRGDGIIGLVMNALRPDEGAGSRGPDVREVIDVLEKASGQTSQELSEGWHSAIYQMYDIAAAPTPKRPPGEFVVIGARSGSGSLNVGPALSPDGTKITYLSEAERLSIDLYLADATTGKVLRRLIRTGSDPHFESLQFLASAGTWAPDNRRLAVATIRRGKPVIAIVDTDNGRVRDEIEIGDVDEVFQPAWSPDGASIAFSGQAGGFTDLYVLTLSSHAIRRLTNDEYADLQPAWSPDGTRLAFLTDRNGGSLDSLDLKRQGLATITLADARIEPLNTGVSGNSANPQWTSDGRSIWFISDTGGRSDVYKLDLQTGRASRMTDVITAVAGITAKSPALSVAARAPRAAMTVFLDQGYEIQFLDLSKAAAWDQPVGSRDLADLPPAERRNSAVASVLADAGSLPADSTFTEEPFKNRFGLVDVGQQVGVSTSTRFGTSLYGGVALTFSDILGNHILSTGFLMNGGARDIGASALYLNRKSRFNWAVFGERAPLVSGSVNTFLSNANGRPVIVEQTILERQTYHQGGGLVAYPFSRTARVEFSGAARHIGFTRDINTAVFDAVSGNQLDENKTTGTTAPSLSLFDVGTAFVRDTASFGPIGPVLGQRLRLDLTRTAGDLSLTEVTGDARRYWMPKRPVTFVARGLFWGRYGSDAADERLYPLYLGYSTLVRGYDVNSIQPGECVPSTTGACTTFDRLFGSRIAVVNLEARVPAVGLFTGKLDYGPVPVELFGFFDAGTAWSSVRPSLDSDDWIRSVGVGSRVNVLGFLIAEFNLARPLDRPGRGWLYVFNFRPGF